MCRCWFRISCKCVSSNKNNQEQCRYDIKNESDGHILLVIVALEQISLCSDVEMRICMFCRHLALQLRNSFSELSLGGLGQLTVDALWTTLLPALLVLGLQDTKSQNYSEQLLWTVQFRNNHFISQWALGRLEPTNWVISTLCMDASASTCFSMKAFVFVSLLCVYLIVFFSWCVWWTRLCVLADQHRRRAELQQSGLNLHNTGEMQMKGCSTDTLFDPFLMLITRFVIKNRRADDTSCRF